MLGAAAEKSAARRRAAEYAFRAVRRIFVRGGADEPSGGQWRRRRRRASAAGARIEALAPRGVGAGGGVPLPRQLGGLGERCKLPQWGPGRSPGRF